MSSIFAELNKINDNESLREERKILGESVNFKKLNEETNFEKLVKAFPELALDDNADIDESMVKEADTLEDEVREVPSSRKDWVITGAAKEPYVWDDPSTITAEELTNAMTARQTYLATVKQRADEYKAQRAAGGSAGAPAAGDFNF